MEDQVQAHRQHRNHQEQEPRNQDWRHLRHLLRRQCLQFPALGTQERLDCFQSRRHFRWWNLLRLHCPHRQNHSQSQKWDCHSPQLTNRLLRAWYRQLRRQDCWGCW